MFPFIFVMVLLLGSKVISGFHRSLFTPPIRCLRKSSLLKGITSSFSLGSKESKTSKYSIVKYPDPRLRAENEVVTIFDESLERLAQTMLELMYQADGIGLAAPQIGVNKRIMVFNEEGSPLVKEKEMILINPYIISKSEKVEFDLEGCLSFPTIRGDVPRHQWIEVDYQTLKGEKTRIKFIDFPARLFQHEYDHLDKVLFIDRFNQKDKDNNAKKLEKLIRRYGPGGVL